MAVNKTSSLTFFKKEIFEKASVLALAGRNPNSLQFPYQKDLINHFNDLIKDKIIDKNQLELSLVDLKFEKNTAEIEFLPERKEIFEKKRKAINDKILNVSNEIKALETALENLTIKLQADGVYLKEPLKKQPYEPFDSKEDETSGKKQDTTSQEKKNKKKLKKETKNILSQYALKILFIGLEFLIFKSILNEYQDFEEFQYRLIIFTVLVFVASFLLSAKLSLKIKIAFGGALAGITYFIFFQTIYKWFMVEKGSTSDLEFQTFLFDNITIVSGAFVLVTLALFFSNLMANIRKNKLKEIELEEQLLEVNDIKEDKSLRGIPENLEENDVDIKFYESDMMRRMGKIEAKIEILNGLKKDLEELNQNELGANIFTTDRSEQLTKDIKIKESEIVEIDIAVLNEMRNGLDAFDYFITTFELYTELPKPILWADNPFKNKLK